MDLTRITQRFQHTLSIIEASVADVSDHQARWKPTAGDWSLLEVVHHLADEEREDFRRRLILTLYYPEQTWPPIDPGAWVTQRRYQERDLEAGISRFRVARKDSIQWLGTLTDPAWDSTVQQPWGPVSAGDLITAWLAHDLLHIRQLNALHYGYHVATADPYSPIYAGDW